MIYIIVNSVLGYVLLGLLVGRLVWNTIPDREKDIEIRHFFVVGLFLWPMIYLVTWVMIGQKPKLFNFDNLLKRWLP